MLNTKRNSNIKRLLTLIMVLMMVFSTTPVVLAGAGGGGGGGSLPLIFLDTNLSTINGQSATPGTSIVANTNVPSGSNTIEIQFDKNITSDTLYNGQTVYANNQKCVTFKDRTNNSNVTVSVYRLGGGSTADLEKQHLFFTVNLLGSHSYEIKIDASLIANNGVILGATKYVDFTTAAPIPKPLDKIALTTAITKATTFLGSKIVGPAVGNVSKAAHDAYNTAIANATLVKNKTSVTQAQVDAAVTTLATATATFNTAVIPVGIKSALNTALTKATTLLASKTVGSAVGNVPKAAHDAYYTAIVNATRVRNSSSANQTQVNAAVTTLATATATFNTSVIPVGSKSALNIALTKATTLLASKTVGSAVGNVSKAAHDAYYTAIVNATIVRNSSSANQAQVNVAVTVLATATTTFNRGIIQ